jgi:hypothetical protein
VVFVAPAGPPSAPYPYLQLVHLACDEHGAHHHHVQVSVVEQVRVLVHRRLQHLRPRCKTHWVSRAPPRLVEECGGGRNPL